ncbi:MAG: hypothetical protein FJY38_03230 [Betaproteobacteria bacterium]|nr:hypothetical protein [Betaproteobacteria bacterium]
MTIAFWCLLIVAVLPIVCAGIAKAGGEAYDNHNPREWLDRQEGFRKRATAAQQNSWEAFGFFTAAVFVAHASGGPSEAVDQMAIAFVVARALFILTYVADWAMVRSLVWFAGFFLTISIFVSAA